MFVYNQNSFRSGFNNATTSPQGFVNYAAAAIYGSPEARTDGVTDIRNCFSRPL